LRGTRIRPGSLTAGTQHGHIRPCAPIALEVADALNRLALANRFQKLIVVAPPKVLGNLRKAFHKEVRDRLKAEVPKAGERSAPR
jgi:protein required for attachment to host cells